MTLFEQLRDYFFEPGLICQFKLREDQKNPQTASEDPSGNGLLYLSIGAITARRSYEDQEPWRSTFVKAVTACSIQPGLVKRTPRKPDQEGPDDYVGMAAASTLMAKQIADYGLQNSVKVWGPIKLNYVYNTENPLVFSSKAWFGRQRQLIAHIRVNAGYDVSYLDALIWAYTINNSINAKPDDHDAWMLSWLLHLMPPNYDFCREAAKNWRQSTLDKYGPTWCQGIAARTLEVNHPIGNRFIF